MRYWLAAAVLAACVCLPLSGFSVTSIMSGYVLGPGKWSLSTSVTPFYDTNILTIVDVGLRVGLPGNLDAGLKVYWLGAIADLKYMLLVTPLSITLDAEVALASEFSVGGAIILDIDITSFLAAYISARLRYPVNGVIDWGTWGLLGGYPSGGAVFTRGGLEILRGGPFTINIEGGTAISWRTPAPAWTAGVMVTWKI